MASDPTAAERAREVIANEIVLSPSMSPSVAGRVAAESAVAALLAHPDLLAALAVEAGGFEQVGWVEDLEHRSWPVLYNLSTDAEDHADEVADPSLRPVYRRVEGERDGG